jgi:Txe/YoeB family toxin of Txe-Axe toxin-antitoxin module
MPRVISDWHGRDPKSRNIAREHRQVYPLTSDQVDKMLCDA